MRLRQLAIALSLLLPNAASAQVFVTALGGAAALSNGAAAAPSPARASNYDSKVGPGLTVAVGYHFNNWFSAQAGYFWNQNRIIATEVLGEDFRRRESTQRQDIVAAELLGYVRPRGNRIRPFLSAGPAWIHISSVNKLGLRVAVGADLAIRPGWGVRYTFSETMLSNPLGTGLNPPIRGKLMNFRNMVGIFKTF